MKFSFKSMLTILDKSYTGRGMKSYIAFLGLKHPAQSTDMYIRGESKEYILAACLAVMSTGA